MQRLGILNRRKLDPIAARCYYYYSLIYEQLNQLSSIREFLHIRFSNATRKNDIYTQATIANLILRNYLHYNLYGPAQKFVLNISITPTTNSEVVKFHYYVGRIQAIMQEYSDSYLHLELCNSGTIGFQQEANKYLVIVKLLMGQIPDKALFRSAASPHIGYLEICQAVYQGSVKKFDEIVLKHCTRFIHDKTYLLIERLRRHVIRTGIKTISLAYSKIHLSDIIEKLQMSCTTLDLEFIISKMIKDGLIVACVNHDEQIVEFDVEKHTHSEIYNAFNKRVQFCFQCYNKTMRAIKYPPTKATTYKQDKSYLLFDHLPTSIEDDKFDL